MIKRLSTKDKNFLSSLEKLLDYRGSVDYEKVSNDVDDILKKIRLEGDSALLSLTEKLDGQKYSSISELEVVDFDGSLQQVPKKLKNALEISAQRIRTYHNRQVQESWEYVDDKEIRLGQKVTALDTVGIYVPGGTACYPSSVLMNAIPAKVAGVRQIIMVVPAPNRELSREVLAAAELSGVSRIFKIGGAQAIGALAYGTSSVPKVDKIVGPGNLYVATAKSKVFGTVGIDMMAGPSEVLIICDGKTPVDWIAMDLLAQAEHDEKAQAILVSQDADFLNSVEGRLKILATEMPRSKVMLTSLREKGALIKVETLKEAIDIANVVAPEHLELSVENARSYVDSIRNAGALFIGRYTPESFGDYCAGTNHVLPTSGSARFSSALGVSDFQKKTSIVECSEQGAKHLSEIAAAIGMVEGLDAHAMSALMRGKG